jgi:undecaprenyl-diphosphatase
LPLVARGVRERITSRYLYGYTKAIGAILIFNGLVLFISDFLAKAEQGRAQLQRSLRRAYRRTVPGMRAAARDCQGRARQSRAGCLCGFKRDYAVKFSFIMSIPAIIGANILSVPDIIDNPIPQSDIFAYICGMAAALVTGIAAMKLLMYISKKSNFRVFSIYCMILGAVALIFG